MTVKIFYYYFSYFGVAAVLAALLVPLMRPLSFRVGAVDNGTGRRAHTGIIPRLGGIGIFLAFMIPAVFSLTRGETDVLHVKIAGIFAASAVVFILGVCDDIRGARIWKKLTAEILAATIIYMLGVRISEISNPFGGVISLGWTALPVTVLWIVVITNAINLIDGLDGLAAGTGVFIIMTLFILSGDFYLKVTFIIMAGSLVGFLLYNFPPASIFMGDSGSLFLGFFLGCISILSAHKATAIATVMIPLLAFGLPIMDMFYAVLRRYYRGLPLGEADKEHIHHKLLQKGFSKKKVLLLLYAMNISLMLIVLVMVRQQLNIDFFGLLFLAVIAVIGLRLLGYIEFIKFFSEMHRNYDIRRRRKYFHYVVKRFRHDAGRSKSVEELRSHLNVLMKEYDFNSVSINIAMLGDKTPFYTFRNRPEPDKPMELIFPVCSGDKEYMGEVQISKNMDDDCFLCTAEMVSAISEEVSRFVVDHIGSIREKEEK
jgi:UDP-GlcNAc:undecaprenyl-phosphate GlcNAc-1-phosphate transferase